MTDLSQMKEKVKRKLKNSTVGVEGDPDGSSLGRQGHAVTHYSCHGGIRRKNVGGGCFPPQPDWDAIGTGNPAPEIER
ncbi:hypothetical protein KJ564_09710 [bacterium]|nr:hypothetical protein [bacterium]